MHGLLPVILVALSVMAGVAAFSHWWDLHGGGRLRRESEARRKAEREARAQALGWHYDGNVQGDIFYRIHGISADGTTWCVHYDADLGSSSSRPKLVFLAPALATREYCWIIHDRKTFALSQRSAVKAVVSRLAWVAGAFSQSMQQRRSFYLHASPQTAGSKAFQCRYVLASREASWSALVDPDTERQILHFPFFISTMDDVNNCFSAAQSPEGLRVQLYCDAPDFAVIEHLALLGERLAANSERLKVFEISEPRAFHSQATVYR